MTSNSSDNIRIKNSSFEHPVLPTIDESPDGYFTSTTAGDVIPGWEPYDPNGLITGIPTDPGGNDFTGAGVYNATGLYPGSIPDGVNLGFGFVVDPPGSGVVGLTQTLNATFDPNNRYTLVVDVGNTPNNINEPGDNYDGFPGYRLELLAGGEVVDYTLNPVSVGEGQFRQVAFSIFAPGATDLAGKQLGIRLINLNEGPGIEVDFDNVQLFSQPTEDSQRVKIKNASFERPVLPTIDESSEDYFTSSPAGDVIPGWQVYDPNGLITGIPVTPGGNDFTDAGVSNATGFYFNGATEGSNAGFSFVTDAPGSGVVGLTQTLTEKLTANTRYNLIVDVGNPGNNPASPTDLTGFPGYQVELLAGDTVIARDNNTLQISEGSFATSTVNFIAGADNSLLGENLTIRLVNPNGDPGIEVDFDNVGLSTEKVADGSSIYIDNPGFELPAVADGDFTLTPPPGWQLFDPLGLIPQNPTNITSSVGVFNPLPENYPNGVPEGQNVGFGFLVNQPGSGFAGISQELDTVVTANTRYTLTVDVGNPQGIDPGSGVDFTAGFPGYRVELLADGEVIGVDNNSLKIQEGQFDTATVSFSAAHGDSILGDNLGIRLVNLNTGEGTEVDFDQVHLKAETDLVNPITRDQELFGNRHNKTLNGGQGNDSIYSNDRATTIFGRDGNDTIYGSHKDEYIVGGAGNDLIHGNGGKDTIYGDDGNDQIYGGSEADTIFAGAGNDTIYGNGGADFINSGVGLDSVWLGSGAATVVLDKGEGYDTIHNFQLGSTKFKVSSLDHLQFTDGANGTKIFQDDDLLAIAFNQSASTFSCNSSEIFV